MSDKVIMPYALKVPVSWTTIKEIYRKCVDHFGEKKGVLVKEGLIKLGEIIYGWKKG